MWGCGPKSSDSGSDLWQTLIQSVMRRIPWTTQETYASQKGLFPLTQLGGGGSVITRIWAGKPRDHCSTAMCLGRLGEPLSFLYRKLFSGGKVAEEELTTHLHPASMLKMRGSIYPSVHMSSRLAQGLCLSLCTNTSPDLRSSSSLQRVPFTM
jgi:hypothetical protein